MLKNLVSRLPFALGVMVVLVLIQAGCRRPAVSPGHPLSLRLAADTQASGMTEATLRSTGTTVFVSSQSLVGSSEFEAIRLAIDEKGRPALAMRVTEAAGQRLEKATAENQGKLLAIVIGTNVELALPIDAPFGREFWLRGSFTNEEIDQAYAAITGYD